MNTVWICMYKAPVPWEFEVITKQLTYCSIFVSNTFNVCDRNLWCCFYCELGKGMGKGRWKEPGNCFSLIANKSEHLLQAHKLSSWGYYTEHMCSHLQYIITIFPTEFISSISCILLDHTCHICCGEGDRWPLGNCDGGCCELPQSSSGLGGRTAWCHLCRWLCLPAVSHERKSWRLIHSNGTTVQVY